MRSASYKQKIGIKSHTETQLKPLTHACKLCPIKKKLQTVGVEGKSSGREAGRRSGTIKICLSLVHENQNTEHSHTIQRNKSVRSSSQLSEKGETCLCVSELVTMWLEGCWGRLRIMASISSNLRAVFCTSEWISLYSAYWSLNTARYWSRSSLVLIVGYLLRFGGN